MDRKKFINMTGALVVLGPGRAAGKQEIPPPAERWQKMYQAWITSLMESLDAHVDEPARTRLMLSAGRACARRSMVKAAQAFKGDLDGLQWPPS